MRKGIYLFLTVLIVACSGSDDSGNNSNSLLSSWQVTVDGQTYEESSPIPIYAGGFGPQYDCDSPTFEQFFPEIDTATRYYAIDLSHYYLTSRFNGVSEGSYPIIGDYLDGECNFTLGVLLSDFSDNVTSSLSNGIHNVTSINQISSTNNETLWSVEGNFSGTFSANNIESVSLTGRYRSVIATYQD